MCVVYSSTFFSYFFKKTMIVTAMDIKVTLFYFLKMKKSPRVGTHGHFSQKFENRPLQIFN